MDGVELLRVFQGFGKVSWLSGHVDQHAQQCRAIELKTRRIFFLIHEEHIPRKRAPEDEDEGSWVGESSRKRLCRRCGLHLSARVNYVRERGRSTMTLFGECQGESICIGMTGVVMSTNFSCSFGEEENRVFRSYMGTECTQHRRFGCFCLERHI